MTGIVFLPGPGVMWPTAGSWPCYFSSRMLRRSTGLRRCGGVTWPPGHSAAGGLADPASALPAGSGGALAPHRVATCAEKLLEKTSKSMVRFRGSYGLLGSGPHRTGCKRGPFKPVVPLCPFAQDGRRVGSGSVTTTDQLTIEPERSSNRATLHPQLVPEPGRHRHADRRRAG